MWNLIVLLNNPEAQYECVAWLRDSFHKTCELHGDHIIPSVMHRTICVTKKIKCGKQTERKSLAMCSLIKATCFKPRNISTDSKGAQLKILTNMKWALDQRLSSVCLWWILNFLNESIEFRRLVQEKTECGLWNMYFNAHPGQASFEDRFQSRTRYGNLNYMVTDESTRKGRPLMTPLQYVASETLLATSLIADSRCFSA